MGYRRKREDTQELRCYKAFVRDNQDLIDRAGLPAFVVDEYNTFLYFLMHGALWQHAPIDFDVDKLRAEQRAAFLLLLDKYFEARLPNPGLILPQHEQEALAQTYPEQFASCDQAPGTDLNQ